jgi:tetratricopeptide (TPR) repeat protein
MTHHPTEQELERFLARRLDPADQSRVVRHLLAGCAVCSRRIGALEAYASLQSLTPKPVPEQDLLREDGPKLEIALEALRAISDGQGASDFQQVPPLRGRKQVEFLLQKSFELRYTDSKAMEVWSYKALQAAEGLRVEDYSVATIYDLQARAWGELANSFAIGESKDQAAAAFRRARALLRQGTQDLYLLAHLSCLEASFHIDQRRLDQAHDLLSGSHFLYARLGDRHLAGRTLILKGTVLFYENRYTESVKTYQKAIPMIDNDREPVLLAVAQQCMVDALLGLCDYRKAGELFLKSGLRQSFANSPLGLARIRWTEGKLLAGLGKASAATRALFEVRGQFLDGKFPHTSAIVDLDLLPLLLRQGKFSEVRGIAKQAYGTLRDLKIDREAVRAKPYLV